MQYVNEELTKGCWNVVHPRSNYRDKITIETEKELIECKSMTDTRY